MLRDFIYPSPLPKLFAGATSGYCSPNPLAEKWLPRLLREPKGRKPAFPGQTGDDIVTSLSRKLLNTTSCQGPLPAAPSPHADALEPGRKHQARAPPPAQPRPAAPARTSAWSTQETRRPASFLEVSCLQGIHTRAPHPWWYHIPVQGWEYPTTRGWKMLFSNPTRTWLCPPCPRDGLIRGAEEALTP